MANRQGVLHSQGTAYDRANIQEGSRYDKRGNFIHSILTRFFVELFSRLISPYLLSSTVLLFFAEVQGGGVSGG